MSNSYFDHNRNLQINGDINFFGSGGSTQYNDSFLQVSQRVQVTNTHSRTIERGFELLCNNTAPLARYGSGHSFTGPQCHPGTRIAVQDHIFKWLADENGQIAMWMNGPVGIGKSAIAQTVAHMAAERGQLSSVFFFFRSDDTRNSTKSLVPTLAYEMTQQMPHTLDRVCQAIVTNPLIFSSPIERQICDTLLKPLCSPVNSPPSGRRLIIIDGLDECLNTNAQRAIIQSFVLSLLAVSTESVPHKLLIVSRPETHITSAFSAANIRPHVKHLALEAWKTEDDIGIFLRAKLDEIKQTHPLKHYLADIWPDCASFCILRQRSVGSFAYASVAIRYLESHNRNPKRALQDLLCLRPSRAAAVFTDLDELYRHILLTLDPEILFTLKKVLCLYVYCNVSSIIALAALLLEEKSDIEIAIICVPSVIRIHNTNKSGPYMGFHHSSFQEFLRDKERSGTLYVFSPDVTSAVATALSNLWLQPIRDLDTYNWFSRIAEPMKTAIDDMGAQILSTLVATQLPTSFFSAKLDIPYPADHVVDFFQVIQCKSEWNWDFPRRALCNRAFDVVCAWLRSQFNLFLQGASTLENILDVILGNDKHLSLFIFRRLAIQGRGSSFRTFCRVFPELDDLEIYAGILERYLALPSDARIADMKKYNLHRQGMLTMLYLNVLLTDSARIPSLCHKLERVVLLGGMALSPVPSPDLTSWDCLFRFFYGDLCYINNESELAVDNRRVSDILKEERRLDSLVVQCSHLAERTDQYIRRTHEALSFAYISESVEALYFPRKFQASF